MAESGQGLKPAARETTDVRFGSMLALLVGIGCTLLLLVWLARLLFPGEVLDRRFAQPFPDYPAPTLQPSPRADMQKFYAQEMQQLNGAGWQDRATGAVHIPIAQAMALIAKEGVPGWPDGNPGASLGDRR